MAMVNEPWLDAHRVDPASLASAPLIGIDHVEGEIASLVARLADPARVALLGAEVPRSVLLHGPAGIGKTHSARALAQRLGGLPVYEVGADELTAPVVRALFPALEVRHPRSILVVDEIDLVGAERSESDAGTRRTLAALLTALDGLRPAAGVLVIAATSQPTWDLDAALLRAGRPGFVIELRNPDEPTRARLLAHFLAGRPLAPDVDLDPLAAMARGDTPADLRAACADAAGIALAAGRDAITQADLVAALGRGGRVLPAEPEPGPIDLATLRRVCAHEAGHLVAGSVLGGPDRLLEVKIGPEAGSVVFVTGDGEADLGERTPRDAITTLLAGFAAERIILGTGSLAHSADVREAMTIARRLVEGGLEPGVPPLDARVPWLDGTTARDRFADAIAALLAAGRERAAGILGSDAVALEDEVMPRLADDTRREPVVLDLDALRADLARLLAPGEPETVDAQPALGPIPAASVNGRLH